jgi:uncharacterized membrane protein
MNVNRILGVGSVVAIALSLPFFGRDWNRFMHLLGGVLFLGNIFVTAVWMSLVRRSKDAEVIRVGARGILLTDALFTLPGVILLFLNGGMLGAQWFKAGAPWIMVSVVLFALSGIVWGAVLVPIQKRLARLAEAMPPHGPVPPECDTLIAKWFRWGGVATLLPLVTFVLMVFKPVFR